MDRAGAIRALEIERYSREGIVEDAIDTAIAALREQEQSKWISVKERLPRNGEMVLCNTKSYFEVLQFDGRANDWCGITRCYPLSYVTHWMPLPQPPKGE